MDHRVFFFPSPLGWSGIQKWVFPRREPPPAASAGDLVYEEAPLLVWNSEDRFRAKGPFEVTHGGFGLGLPATLTSDGPLMGTGEKDASHPRTPADRLLP